MILRITSVLLAGNCQVGNLSSRLCGMLLSKRTKHTLWRLTFEKYILFCYLSAVNYFLCSETWAPQAKRIHRGVQNVFFFYLYVTETTEILHILSSVYFVMLCVNPSSLLCVNLSSLLCVNPSSLFCANPYSLLCVNPSSLLTIQAHCSQQELSWVLLWRNDSFWMFWHSHPWVFQAF